MLVLLCSLAGSQNCAIMFRTTRICSKLAKMPDGLTAITHLKVFHCCLFFLFDLIFLSIPTFLSNFVGLYSRLLLVVWNPWEEKAKAMSDFGDDEYPKMLCVEAGHVSSPVTLDPGASFIAGQVIVAK